MKKIIIAMPLIIIVMFIFVSFISINLEFNDTLDTFISGKNIDNKVIETEIGTEASKFYSDKSLIKLYNKHGTLFVDFNNNLYKIDLKEIKNKIKNIF